MRLASADQGDVPPDRCPPEGTATSADGQALNRLKNRDTAPTPAQVNPQVTLAAMLADGDDTGRFDPSDGATIEGYVIKVVQGGHPETANCDDMSLANTDTHIQVALAPDATPAQSIVAEVTPRWRERMAAQGADWGTETLAASLVGHKVRFTGWLLFDTAHVGELTNTAPDNPNDWRKTAWEVHPITAMMVDPAD